MAFCGTKFLDENKGVDSDEELRENNVCNFPTSELEMFDNTKEFLLLKDSNGKEIDRRMHILYKEKDFHLGSYFMLCQLTCKTAVPNKVCTGSGCFEFFSDDKRYLTCAHNLTKWGPRRNKMVMHQGLKVYQTRQGESYLATANLDYRKIFPHPMFDGNPNCGFDIGMFSTEKANTIDPKEVVKSHGSVDTVPKDVLWHYANPGDLKIGMKVEVSGYPGKKCGEPYTAVGEIKGITTTRLKGHLIWYDVDSTPGNSGSCIMVTDPQFLKTVTKDHRIKKVVVGVHTGHDRSENLNYGTLITESIYDWLQGL